MFQTNNINTNTVLQIDYNRIIKLIEESSENLSTKISTAETTLKRKIEGISYNVAQSSTANQDLHDETSTKIRKKKINDDISDLRVELVRVKEILIQQTQLNNNINDESPPSSPYSSNNDTRYRKGLSNLAPLVHYKIKEHLTNKELSDKRELSSNVVISEEYYLVDLEQTLGSHHKKMVMNKYVEFL